MPYITTIEQSSEELVNTWIDQVQGYTYEISDIFYVIQPAVFLLVYFRTTSPGSESKRDKVKLVQ